MSAESSQKKVGRNRPPRVHITYDVDVGDDVTELKEIPFRMGVMSDLSGDNADQLPELSERKFTEVDANTFDKFMKSQKPAVTLEVDNTLTGEGKLKVNMEFASMDDFSPAAVAQKVDGLKQLYEKRQQLQELLTNSQKKPKLEKAMQDALGRLPVDDPEAGKKLLSELGDGEKK